MEYYNNKAFQIVLAVPKGCFHFIKLFLKFMLNSVGKLKSLFRLKRLLPLINLNTIQGSYC